MPDMANVCLDTLIQKGFEIAAVIPPPNSNTTSRRYIDSDKTFNPEVFEDEVKRKNLEKYKKNDYKNA